MFHSSSRPSISLKKQNKKSKMKSQISLVSNVFHSRNVHLSFVLLSLCVQCLSILSNNQISCCLLIPVKTLSAYLSPKNCPDSLPSEVKVAEDRVTMPLNFLGEISPRYIKCVLCPKPAGHDRLSISQVKT